MNSPSRFPALLFCAFALLSATGAVHAQTIVDDFNDGNDLGWTQVSPLADFGSAGSFSFPGGNSYRIQAPASLDPDNLGPARAAAIRRDATFGDFNVTVDLVNWDDDALTHQSIGIVARVSDLGLGMTDGYFLHYDPHGTGGHSSIWIEGITDEIPFSLASLQVALDLTKDYRLEFTGTGSSLVGRVYGLSDLSTALYEVSAIDPTYASGYVGLLVAAQGSGGGNQAGDATFDNFSATSPVPEPSTYAALAGVLALGIAAFGRRTRAIAAAREGEIVTVSRGRGGAHSPGSAGCLALPFVTLPLILKIRQPVRRRQGEQDIGYS